ncbi:MAG: hypothetical protein EZS28_001672 [Streblomastix strix]|uniref:Uncharacterized protein n=1 Tax=Streblomastix strix TaxID=222440 RepID=A0A5J4X6K7_9EUKA|nr:MAG: hypothetical protein EZS28_001672 [Streblomastix strix]
MPLQPSVKGNSTSTHTPPNILRLPGFYVIFVFEEVESFMAGASWTEIVRAIERSTVPPVFDHDAFGLFDKLGDNTSQTHDSPQNMLFRGFFAIKSTETILDLKIRVLHEIRNSSKARRWWRRHMGTTIPLYAKPTPLKASFGDSDINKYHSQKYLKGKHWTEANQSKQSLQSIDISTNNLQSLKKIISHMAIADAGKINPNQQFENFSVKMNEIEDMIPRPEEPDLSDLESTSYISSDYDEEINNLSKNRENEEINSNNIQKRGYKKKKKDIDHNYYQDHTEPQRRTVRIQPEDFVCYACRIKPPEGELQGTNIRSASIQQLKPTPKPISPYCKKQSVVGTELFPAFSPYAATYELPPPPEIDPQFNMTQNNNNQIIQNHQHSFPPLRSLASESYTQFRSKQKPNEFSLNVEIGDKYNTLINDPILCKDNEKSISALKNLYKNEKDQPKDINCIDKQMNKKNKKKKKQQESFPNDNRIPLLIFCVPGKIHVFDLHKKQNIETESNKSNKNEDDIDLKGEMCIVMTQGRKLMNQLIIPKEMPFVNVLRLLSIGAYTSHETYLNDNLDIKYLNANQFIAGRVISNNADGKRQLIINRHFFDYGIQKREKDSQLDPKDQIDSKELLNGKLPMELFFRHQFI